MGKLSSDLVAQTPDFVDDSDRPGNTRSKRSRSGKPTRPADSGKRQAATRPLQDESREDETDRDQPRRERTSQRDLLIECASGASLWHDTDATGYATVAVNGHREHYKIRSQGFRSWLLRQFYGRFTSAPNSQAQEDALRLLEAAAQFDGPEHKPATRIAELDGKMYLDLCNDQWQVVEIDATGWRIVDHPPVKFIRHRGMLPLPTPEQGSNADLGDLRELLNVPDDSSWRLLLASMVAMFRAVGPYPVVVIIAEQGSGKSFLCRVVRSLIDPSRSPLRSQPKEERDLLISASNAWLVVSITCPASPAI
ncbi:MAG TPA: hypothetical protein V6D08_11815 [Candidatus Obscuribacterales bacterium]